VFLEEGNIRLDLGDQDEYLDPGDYIVYSAEQKMITQRQKSPAEEHTSWKDGSLILQNVLVAEVLVKMEEIYGLDLKLENEAILRENVTLAIPMDKAEIAIPILDHLLGKWGVSVKKVDNQLIIK
jgi:ferric-dicitrate binding protein FerR (iron transport regulator)